MFCNLPQTLLSPLSSFYGLVFPRLYIVWFPGSGRAPLLPSRGTAHSLRTCLQTTFSLGPPVCNPYSETLHPPLLGHLPRSLICCLHRQSPPSVLPYSPPMFVSTHTHWPRSQTVLLWDPWYYLHPPTLGITYILQPLNGLQAFWVTQSSVVSRVNIMGDLTCSPCARYGFER